MKTTTKSGKQPPEWWQDISKQIEQDSKARCSRGSLHQIDDGSDGIDQETVFSGDIFKKMLQKNEIKNLKQNRKQRKKYAQDTFDFMKCYVKIVGLLIFIIIILGGLGILKNVPSWPLSAMASTIVASMALFGWVLRGLFPLNEEVKS